MVRGSFKPVAVELAQLGHPVPHRLSVHEQIGGDRVALTLVQQPRTQGLGQPVGGGGTQLRQWRKGLPAQIGGGVGIGGQHQLDEMVVGVDDVVVHGQFAGPQRAAIGRLREHPWPGRTHQGAAPLQRRPQLRAVPAVEVGHQQHCE